MNVSEGLDNRAYRQQKLKEFIMELHEGASLEDVKDRFAAEFGDVSTEEIVSMEQGLVAEGMPVEEIQRLCDVHASLFQGSIADIHGSSQPGDEPGHPLQVFKQENRALEQLLEAKLQPALAAFAETGASRYLQALERHLAELYDVDKHYARKENLVFPYLEKAGITAPPKVMWGVDDEIRDLIKKARRTVKHYRGDRDDVVAAVEEAVRQVKEMISKEENILFPLVQDTLTEDEWWSVYESTSEFGYCLVAPEAEWKPLRVPTTAGDETAGPLGRIPLETGALLPTELNAMLKALPLDITFVDKDGIVRYFSQTKERIFARPKTIIGRRVENCHPPASVHIVQKIVEELQAGKRDSADFWITMGEQYVYIRYFPVRDVDGEYLGTIEVTQDIKPIQAIQGERRLLKEDK